jgi:stress response protein SCP2
MKGQKIPITGSGRLKIGLGWDVNDSRCDLDASAFMLDKNNRIVGDEWFIFYGQDKSPDSSVQYKVFDISVACEDDAELTIDLNKVSPNVEKILIAITIYEASANRLNFGMVQNVYARIMDADTGKETSRFVQDECYSNVTALVLGELYRYKGALKFNAVGSGVARDLAEFCAMYGVVME